MPGWYNKLRKTENELLEKVKIIDNEPEEKELFNIDIESNKKLKNATIKKIEKTYSWEKVADKIRKGRTNAANKLANEEKSLLEKLNKFN